MPSRVHALLVVRSDGQVAPDIHLRRTLTALAAQSRPVDALTIVVCGEDPRVSELAATSGAEGVITASRSTRFADALRMASRRLDGDAVWLLAQDTAPEPEALSRLAGALETAPSVAFAAPKLVRWDDRTHIVSLGVTMTRAGRTVGLADDEHDQGQHDARDDVLGSDVRGVLVRADAWRRLGGLDPALDGADEGLDLGVRAHLAGGRVVLAATAVVAVAGDGVAGRSRGDHVIDRARTAFAERSAALHRRLVYAPSAAVVLHWLSLVPLALVRSVGHLLTKRPGAILPELLAAVVAAARIPSVVRARRSIRATRAASWSLLSSLRIGSRQLRHRLDDDGDDALVRPELGFFRSSGGAWIVLAALVVSLVAFPTLLTWPVLGGGALAPLRSTVSQLWADAVWGARPLGWDTVGPADPFSAVVAVLGTLSPAAPSRALVALWLLALPLSALGGWFAATRLSERPGPRALMAIGWALAPSLLSALIEGRPTGVIVHLLLPWLMFTAAVAHRSWTYAGVASILLVGVVGSAPSVLPALVILWVTALVLTAVRRRGRGIGRVVWLLVPTAVIAGPLIWRRLREGDPWALLADPGVVAPTTAPSAADAGSALDQLARQLLLAAGYPSAQAGGWESFAPDLIGWLPLLLIPLLVLALVGPAAGRLAPAAVCLALAVAGALTALISPNVVVTAIGSTPVALWAGAGGSLAWLGLLGSAALGLDALPRTRGVRGVSATVVALSLVVLATPALTALHRDALTITNGPESTLPAYVDAEGRGDPNVATFVLSAQRSGGLAAAVIWGSSGTLGAQTTLQAVRTEPTAADRETAAATADLVTGSAGDVVARLAAQGIAYILLDPPAPDESDAARATRLAAEAALDRRDDLESVGDTGKGELWFVIGEVEPRTPTPGQEARAWRNGAIQAGVIIVALLLALPTAATVRAARRRSRVVGKGAPWSD